MTEQHNSYAFCHVCKEFVDVHYDAHPEEEWDFMEYPGDEGQ